MENNQGPIVELINPPYIHVTEEKDFDDMYNEHLREWCVKNYAVGMKRFGKFPDLDKNEEINV